MVGKRKKLYGTSLTGTKLSLEQFPGKTVVVFFWSTQAQPSLDRIPEVTAALKKYGNGYDLYMGLHQDTADYSLLKL